MGGFLQGFYGAVGPKIEELHALEDDQRPQKAAIFWQALSDPKINDPENATKKQQAQEGLKQLYGRSKEGKAKLDRAFQMHDKLFPSQQQQPQAGGLAGGAAKYGGTPVPAQQLPQQPAQPQAQPQQPQPMSDQRRGTLSKILGTVGHGLKEYGKNLGEEYGVGVTGKIRAEREAQASADITAGSLTQDQEEVTFKRWEQRGKSLGLNGRDLAEYAGSKGTKLPSAAIVRMKSVNLEMKDGATVPAMVGTDGRYYDLAGNLLDAAEIKGEAAKQSSAMPRFGTQMITLESAQQQAKAGSKFTGIDGNEIELDKLPPSMVLQPVTIGGKIFFLPIDPANTHLTIGNEVIGTDRYRQNKIGADPNAGVVLGQARTDTESQPSATIVDDQGKVIQVPGLRRPMTPGIQRRPVGSPAPPGAAAPTASAPSRLPAPGAGHLGQRELHGLPAAQQRQFLERWTPVREFATQVFAGDKALISYGDLADDAKARERLGKALNLTFSAIEGASGGAHINADAGPIHVGTGGLGDLLTNAFGVPQALASQTASIQNDAVKDLTPREREYYDAVMASFGTAVGLRSLTRASAAGASVITIERELPLIGKNTVDSTQFKDQLTRLGKEVENGAKGIPNVVMGPDKAMIDSIPGRLDAIGAKKKKRPSLDSFEKK